MRKHNLLFPMLETKAMAFDRASEGEGGGGTETLDMKQIAESFEGINKAFEEFKSTNDAAMKELQKKGTIDPLIEEKLSKINDTMNTQQEALDAYGARMKRMQMFGGSDGQKGESPEELEEKAAKWMEIQAKSFGATGEHEGDFGHAELKGYGKALNRYLRKSEKILTEAEFKALSVGGDPDGGYVVLPDMSGRMVQRVFETSPFRQFANVQTIGTDALEGLHDVDEAGFGWVGETGARPETSTPQIQKYRIPVHEMYAAPRATQKLLDDAAINIEAWLAGKVADRFARAENNAFTSGNGVDRPRGILTYPDYTNPGEFQLGAVERFNTGANGGFVAAPNGGDVLIDALYGLKAPYRANAAWFMARGTTGAVRKLKDSDGAYLWAPGIAAGQPATLLGYPTASFEDMPDIATGSLSIAVGDLNEAYQIVDRMGVRVLRDPFTVKPFVEFYSTKRTGGDVTNFEAYKLIEFSA